MTLKEILDEIQALLRCHTYSDNLVEQELVGTLISLIVGFKDTLLASEVGDE